MSQRLAYILIFMFISPALSLYEGLRSPSDQVKRWSLIAFVTIFGSIIMLNESQDGYVQLQNVYDHYVGLSFTDFSVELYRILTLQHNAHTEEEPFSHILSYFTGGVLGMPGLFFTFVAFIYAYFFAGSMFHLFRIFPRFRYSRLFFGFAVVFLLWKNLEGINPVRAWTGMWVLFYACLRYYQTGRWKYLLLMFIPPLIHIGFGIMAIPAWIVLVFGVHRWIYIGLFALSFGAAAINPGSVTSVLESSDLGQVKVSEYYREKQTTTAETLTAFEGTAWYLQVAKVGAQHWSIVLVAITLILSGAYFREMTPLESRLFSIGLLTKALANSTWFLFAVANRSVLMAGVFILATLLLMWQRGYFAQPRGRTVYQKLALNVAMLLFVPFIIFRMADLIYFVSVFILMLPFVPWFDSSLNISIRQALGELVGL